MNQRLDHVELTRLQYRDPDVAAAQVVAMTNLSPTIKGLTLKLGCESSFKPGQWVDLFIPGVDKVGGFSMSSDPAKLTNENLIDLAVKFSTWPPAHWIHTQCAVGDEVAVRFGGDFYYPPEKFENEDHSIVLIAGGVGINPMYSIWLHARQLTRINSNAKPSKVSMFYSAASEAELIFRDSIDKTAEELSNFSIQYFVTRGPGSTGRISASSLEPCVRSGENSKTGTLYYLCGPPGMIEEVNNMLLNLGVDKEQILYEMWW